MPIQFRCQHCRQLLGISRSKAGSVVDCPACGRTLRVPTVGGATGKPEPVQRQSADTSLASALEELSNLSIGGSTKPGLSSTPVAPAPPVPRKDPRRAAAPEKVTGRDALRIVPLSPASETADTNSAEDALRELAELPATGEFEPLVEPEVLEPEIIDEPECPLEPAVIQVATDGAVFSLPAHLSTALNELSGNVEADRSKDRTQGVTRRAGIPLPIVVVAILLTFAAGYAMALWRGSSDFNKPSASHVQSEQKADDPQKPANASDADTVESITGKVKFKDSAGIVQPDAGALILLMPASNKSGLKLDCSPLRNPEVTPAKTAVEAALNTLGTTFTRAAEDGSFTLGRRIAGPATLIIVSRHVSRPESEPVPEPVATALADWFESPTQLTGRLAAQEKPLSAVAKDTLVPPVDILFGK